MVCPQKGLLVVQLPVPAFGVLSVVKIPPASTAKSAACACAKTDRSNEQKIVTSVLFKMTSQQRLNRWRHYKGSCPRRRCSLSHFDTTLVTLVLRGAVVGRMIVPNRQSAPVPHVLLS